MTDDSKSWLWFTNFSSPIKVGMLWWKKMISRANVILLITT
jgi:hypothetical protein